MKARLAKKGCLVSGLLVVLAVAASGAEPVWTLKDGKTVAGSNVVFQDGIVTLTVTNPPGKIAFPFAELSAAEKKQLLLLEDTPYPPRAPAWLSGYRVRYPLRVVGDLLTATSRTVIARVPTGGWLKTNAADIVVQTVMGQQLPTAVLAHDPIGNTIVQFKRNGFDRWYWAYALNANPPPAKDPLLKQRTAEAAAKAAQLAKMNAQKASADAAEQLARLNAEIARARTTTNNAAAEIAQWDKLLPERAANAGAADEKVVAAKTAAVKAEAEAAAAKARADEQVAIHNRAATNDAARKAAEEATLPVRLAAAKAAAAKADADKQLTALTVAVSNAAAAVTQGQAARADAEQLKNKSVQTITEATAKLPPATAAVNAAQAFAAQAVETARLAAEEHRKIMADTDPTAQQEGLTVEFRQWSGDELVDWATVVAGLRKSENILFNAIVPEVIQDTNPARRSDPRNFAASYRGFLRIETPGVYRFFVNGDDAAYLFINGFKVYSRRGTNRPLTGSAPLFSVGEDMEMEAGVHPFEIHHVVGNTPGAQGVCSFLWLLPGSKKWAFVPRAAFPEALLAVPTTIEEARGGQVAGFQFGMDDTLSSDGVTLYLVRFEAQGNIPQPESLCWDFGDGARATGASVTHIYFREGDYEVSLKSLDSLPPFCRRVHVWSAPIPTSPFSLGKAVELFSGVNLLQLDLTRLNAMFDFLLICGQRARWPVMERLCRHLLNQKGLDIEYRVYLYTALMEAVAQQGRAAESMALMPKALAEVPRLKGLSVMIQRKAADIQRVQLKDFQEAGKLYETIITENRRLRYPSLPQAAIAWGDMFLEAGDQARAGETYRLATMLAAEGGAGEKAGAPTTRGALLRVAEQQLKGGNVRQSRRLLERIENEFPEQKLEGLYRFLRAEADRTSGRYEEARRNYEFLLQLRQWAGYRAQALHGIADSFYRNGDYAKALEWLKGLKESFPDYYAARELPNYQTMIEAMLKRQQELGGAQGMAKAMFQELKWGFEPGLGTNQPALTGARLLPSLGIAGGSTAFIAALPAPVPECTFQVKLQNVASEGEVWIEFWYRDTLSSSRAVANPYIYVDFIGDAGQHSSRETLLLEPTFGEWRKLAARLKAPVTKDGSVMLTIRNLRGLYELDGLQIRPITDQQNEALRAFIEGANPQ
ncbi:MAG: PKD domain-containing protein [Lentisphaerae bacterium]|nr:PKD domain-containing protein [Lentisphaerota bacterium]